MSYEFKKLISKLTGILAICLFLFSSTQSNTNWSIPKIEYVEIATGETKKNSYLECASSSDKQFSGKLLFYNMSGNEVGYIPFKLNPFGLLKKSLKYSEGSFKLFVDYKNRRSLNCYLSSDSEHLLLPFDQEQNEISFISLGSELQDRTAKNVILSMRNLSKIDKLEADAIFYTKDGLLIEDKQIKFEPINPNGRININLDNDILENAGLIKISGNQNAKFSAYVFATGLDEEQYSSEFVSSATRGTCKNKKYQISLEKFEQPILELVNISESTSRAFITLTSRSGQKIYEDSVLLPKYSTYPFRINETSGYVNVSCDQGEILSNPMWKNNDNYRISSKKSYTKISLPIVKRKGIQNIIKLDSESDTPSLISIDLYSKTGEKLFSPFQEVEIQGNLSIPIDQSLSNRFDAVALLSSKRNVNELVRVSLLRKENDTLLKFPEALLTAKEEKQLENLELAVKEDSYVSSNTVARRESDLNALLNDNDFESHCVKRTKNLLPEGLIKDDNLEFDLNFRKLLNNGVTELKAYKVNNLDSLIDFFEKNNYLKEKQFNRINNSLFANEYACNALLYTNKLNELKDYVQEVDSLSVDFRKSLIKGTIEKKLKLSGSAWLKALPDTYLFCFRTAPDCEYEKGLITQYSRSFLSPNRLSILRPSGLYPLLTIDRPFKPKSKNKFQIKTYMQAKVPYEIIAILKGIKAKNVNQSINCKDLNGKYRLILSGNKWISSRQTWDRAQKFDLNLTYNPIAYVHFGKTSSGPVVADNCNLFFKDCHPGMWSVNVANALNSGSEPHGWGRFLQLNKFNYRWNSLPLMEDKEVVFDKFELSNSNDQPRCDYSSAKIILTANKALKTVPEIIAKREAGNTYILPRKIYSKDTYPINQPAPGIPFLVNSNLNPYVSKDNRIELSTSGEMIGVRWLDEIPK